ncbi:Aste57867_13051 [Aphanomyces stellatus]|uniref:Aste57867_13051 protein n=1 Tax=Aphanomyces stellatus TaxID=120398 RepID=A0A485KX55_9STRA|nr:hypothetical protein As57867_013003 [Aphanomyces stellatus]VFT89896.1 Aste57867_13051 [Aphanomyces stellatus]
MPSTAPQQYAKADASAAKPGHGPIYTAGVANKPECATMFEYLQRSADKHATNQYLGHRRKDKDGNVVDYVWETYEQVYGRVKAIASGLVYHNMLAKTAGSGDRVLGIYMKNRPESVLALYAATYAGGFAVLLDDKTCGADALNETQLTTIVCTTAELVKVIQAKATSPLLKHVVVCDVESKPISKAATAAGLTLCTLGHVEFLGSQHISRAVTPIPSDIYCLLYMSDTLGSPKGVPLSHSNMVHAIEAAKDRLLNVINHDELVHCSHMPMTQSLEHIAQGMAMTWGGKVGFYQGDSTAILDDVALLQPTVLVTPPHLLAKVHERFAHGSPHAGCFEACFFRTALKAKLATLKASGSRRHWLYDPLVFSKIQQTLGLGRCEVVLVASSSSVPDDASDFFRAMMACPVIDAYGLTETTGLCTMSLPTQSSVSDVGPPLAHLEAKLISVPGMSYDVNDTHHGEGEMRFPVCGRGEVCVRGLQVVSGYYKQPEATAKAFDEDGWLHTGDIGAWLPDGRLKILERTKSISDMATS